MFITIPPSKELIIANVPTRGVHAWDLDEPDAPKPPNSTVETMEFARDFINRMILNDPTWGTTLERLYIAMEIRTAFRSAKPGDRVEVTKDQYNALVEVMKKPQIPYAPSIAMRLGEFFKAVEEAKVQ